ncbi:DUF1353 domain-containing protein [Pseudomonas sp. 21LCFQ010]|uniref:DUF1353 domain-containing protein n=1 Tax=Pseudomonas sp. 21LCFQ010 TaxID=2957506 RepID=UPI002096DCCD|nr:DUF1353 domain-containing protein [Pseudomonas sp. 21LCFQ010]MCO8164809.1 DUF1353 domain-containing protein [Pseudomonas sp. 21LCFQ010]
MTGRFLDPLVLQAYAKGEWVLMHDFRYQSADGETYTAPKYFITDLASTPWIVRPLLTGIEDRACGVIHDLLYCVNQLSRAVCDALFYEMLLVAGADQRRAGLMHWGLRVGGGPRYSACAGGMKVEDLAFELMSEAERMAWRARLKPKDMRAQG